MTLIESSVTITRRRAVTPAPASKAYRSVVLLLGAHDISTVAATSETLARTIALDDADLVVDLSGVTFMGAETAGVLVRASAVLSPRSRSLQLRTPSARAMRTIELCDLGSLLEPPPTASLPAGGSDPALETWFAAASDPVDRGVSTALA